MRQRQKNEAMCKHVDRDKILIYAVVFVLISLVVAHFGWTTNNQLIDVAFVGVVAGLITHEVAWYYREKNGKK